MQLKVNISVFKKFFTLIFNGMKQIFLLPKLASIFFLVGLMSLTSCKKDNNTTNTDNPDPALSVDAVQSDDNAASQFEDVFNRYGIDFMKA